MKKIALRLISLAVGIVALVVPVAGPLSWFSYSPEVPKELQDKWSR